MALPKFIITMDGYFRLGMVNQHKDLLKPDASVAAIIISITPPTASCSTGNPTTSADRNGICSIR